MVNDDGDSTLLFTMSEDERRESFRRRGMDYDAVRRYEVPLHDGTVFITQLDVFGEPLSCDVIDPKEHHPGQLYNAWQSITKRLYHPRQTDEYKAYMADGIEKLKAKYTGKVYY